MSQRPPASRPASRSPPEGQKIILPPVQLRDDSQQGRQLSERQQHESDGRPPQPHQQHHQQLQPSPQYSRMSQPPTEEWRTPQASRDLGVHSILNPPDSEGVGSSHRRASGGTIESPLSAVGPPSHFGASPSLAASQSFSSQNVASNTPPANEVYGGAFSRTRRILTPRSPARAVSAGRGAAPGRIDAQQSPFLTGRGRPYMAEPGLSTSSDVPPLPTPSSQQQQHYAYPTASSTPASIAPRRQSGPSMPAPGRTPLSQSASPSISASSHGPASSQTSPASFAAHQGGPGAQSSASYYPGSSYAASMQQGGGMQFAGPPAPADPRTYSVPAPQNQGTSLQSSSTGSSRQTSASEPFPVLTYTTLEGQFNVPVETHQASRLADEKRARNAGASARFRKRRKENEIESSRTIEKLQQETRVLERKVKDLETERDHYRTERDRFREVIYRHPEIRHLAAQAPSSPQTMRPGSFSGSMMQMGGPPPPHPPAPLGFSTDGGERAPRRRRTDTQGEFSSLPYGIPPSTTLPPVPAVGYPPGHSHGPASLPPMRIEHPTPPSTTSSTNTPTTSAGSFPPYDPYAARGPYERGWPGERR